MKSCQRVCLCVLVNCCQILHTFKGSCTLHVLQNGSLQLLCTATYEAPSKNNNNKNKMYIAGCRASRGGIRCVEVREQAPPAVGLYGGSHSGSDLQWLCNILSISSCCPHCLETPALIEHLTELIVGSTAVALRAPYKRAQAEGISEALLMCVCVYIFITVAAGAGYQYGNGKLSRLC